ncbi:MAG TPA: hypothetical protein VGI20_13780 [Rhizomicrobium sp.]|jgi:hypothetical protein
MTNPRSEPSPDEGPHGRWPFIRDVLMLQVKLLIGNVHNFILIPATMTAALLDLLFKSGRHGSRFYRVLDWGRQADEAIGLYSALEGNGRESKQDVTIDVLASHLEEAIVREYEKGGTAAGMKSAIDRVLDRVHHQTGKGTTKARDAVQRLKEKLAGSTRSDSH